MIKPWQQVGSTRVGDFRIFTLRSDRRISPRTGKEHDFYVLDCPNWVNVVALTPAGELVMIEQYRHGSDTIELEIPGGVIDPKDSSPEAAGLRELREETGYTGANARVIGEVFPNPAIMSNRCYTVLVENCRQTHALELDQGEDLLTRLVPVEEIPGLVAAGQIRHSLVVAGLFYYELWERGAAVRTRG